MERQTDRERHRVTQRQRGGYGSREGKADRQTDTMTQIQRG